MQSLGFSLWGIHGSAREDEPACEGQLPDAVRLRTLRGREAPASSSGAMASSSSASLPPEVESAL
eukprot:4878056-Alexandrium_andersonii.AAC.1